MTISVSIHRSDSGWAEYSVPEIEGATVLAILTYIHENMDSTLAFRSGCRMDLCGLCAVEVNGKPAMACTAGIEDGMRIGPLRRLPLVRDLVINRVRLFEALRELELFIPEQEERSDPQIIRQTGAQVTLLQCVECLACNSVCEQYDFEKNPLAGPFTFVKLAQLHFDPRNRIDRRRQAQRLGVNRCAECRGCYCIHGINIRKHAIEVLDFG
jgi:succinate dehydrogenase / fumarate reductase iron-sulfur subunit